MVRALEPRPAPGPALDGAPAAAVPRSLRRLDRLGWAFVLSDLGDGRARFHFRTCARLGPPWLAAAYWLVLVPARTT